MRKLVCHGCGFVTELFASSWATQGSLCANCGNTIEPYVGSKSMKGSHSPRLELTLIEGKGLGVVASSLIREDDLIERCPVMVVDSNFNFGAKAYPYEDGSSPFELRHLLLPWVVDGKRCIAFGYGTLYNHADLKSSNAMYLPYVEPSSNRRFIDFYAKRDIEKGQEITQTYASRDRLWFSPKRDKND